MARRSARGDGTGGPTQWPVIGNTIQFARDPFAFYERCAAHGDVVPYTVVNQDMHLVSHPEDIERILVTDRESFAKGSFQREQLGWVLGDGLLTSVGDEWRTQRQRIQPAFTGDRIRSYVEVMSDCAEDAMAAWTPGEPVAIDDAMRRTTVQILARTLFGTDLGDHVETISAAMDDIGALSAGSTLPALLPQWLPTPWNRRAKRGIQAIDGVIDDLIAARRGEADTRDDLLSTLIVAHDAGDIPRSQLRDQLVTFLLAGHETTSLALTYTWYLLASNPAEYDRFHDEIDRILDGDSPRMGDLAELTYTEHAFTEAMRLYPPVYRMLRETREPITLGGRELPAGSLLTLCQWVVHRDDRWYDDPASFRPKRWDRTTAERPEYAYFPFGGGPRRCIGMRFARIEAQVVLATVARRYRFDPVDEPEPLDLKPGVTASPAESVHMIPRER